MKNNTEELYQWGEDMLTFHLPRWHELPSIDLYMDQLISLIERYLAPLSIPDEKIDVYKRQNSCTAFHQQ